LHASAFIFYTLFCFFFKIDTICFFTVAICDLADKSVRTIFCDHECFGSVFVKLSCVAESAKLVIFGIEYSYILFGNLLSLVILEKLCLCKLAVKRNVSCKDLAVFVEGVGKVKDFVTCSITDS